MNVKILAQATANVYAGTYDGDIVIGGAFDDVIFGGGTPQQDFESSYDYVDAGSGNDTVVVDTTFESSYAQARGSFGNDLLLAFGRGNSTLLGGEGLDKLISTNQEFGDQIGGGGDDVLTIVGGYFGRQDGGSGNDRLIYREGDAFVQDASYDGMTGGLGRDVFQIHLTQSGAGYAQIDVLDYSRLQADRVFISEMDGDGNFVRRDTEIKAELDTNHDRRLDASDGYDASIGEGVQFVGDALVLAIGFGEQVVIHNTSSLEFFA